MFEEIKEIVSSKPGPISIILAGVHGNEKSPIEGLTEVLSKGLVLDRGRLLIAYGNPEAIKKNVRFTEANLNRVFKNDLTKEEENSYEYKRAQLLKIYLNKSEVLLDMHASATKDSEPFVICGSNAQNIVKYFPVNLIVSGFDDLEPGGTDYYMNSIGKIGICVECGFLDDPKSKDMAIEIIKSFLVARGHVEGKFSVFDQKEIQMYRIYKTKTDNFKLTKQFNDFERIVSNQIIGVDGGIEVQAEKDGIILFARNRSKIGDEAFLLGKHR